MKIVRIPKKSGGFRTIYVQSPVEKGFHRWVGMKLQQRLERIPESRYIHGFYPGRSPVTNAMAHVGKRYTLTMDIRDFFDSVTADQITVGGALRTLRHPFISDLAKWACKDGAPRQGLSSSPAAANVAGTLLDREVQRVWMVVPGRGVVYTRYADDLTFSSDDLVLLQAIRQWLPKYVGSIGWQINPSKTRIQNAAYGRRTVCGISVGATDIRVPRSFRRKLRAALHQHPGSNKTRGLVEWSKLKPPAGHRVGKYAQKEILEIAERAFAQAASGWSFAPSRNF